MMKLLTTVLAALLVAQVRAQYAAQGVGDRGERGDYGIYKKVILTNQAPSPLGPYSQGIKVSGGATLFVAGQIGLIPGTPNFAGETIEAQTEQALKNIGAILKAAGGDFSNVVKCTIMLADMADFAAMNTVYATFFNVSKPAARAAFAAKSLPKDAKVEIDCIAVV